MNPTDWMLVVALCLFLGRGYRCFVGGRLGHGAKKLSYCLFKKSSNCDISFRAASSGLA